MTLEGQGQKAVRLTISVRRVFLSDSREKWLDPIRFGSRSKLDACDIIYQAELYFALVASARIVGVIIHSTRLTETEV